MAAWVLLALVLWLVAPDWDSIAADGDLAYLPASVPSLIGQKRLREAFPASHSRSQMVVTLARSKGQLTGSDLALGLDLARRLHWYAASGQWAKLPLDQADWLPEKLTIEQKARVDSVAYSLDQCISIDDELAKFLETEQPDYTYARLRDAFDLRAHIYRALGEPAEAEKAEAAVAAMTEQHTNSLTLRHPVWAEQLSDVWTWRDFVLGTKLGGKNSQARMIAMHLDTEFTAVSNIMILEGVEELIRQVRTEHASIISADLCVEVSGSAAVGADMLRASASSVRQTEGVTILLVVTILALVYRGPFLVAIPLISIALSLMVSTSLVALLARDPANPSSLGLGVFTTTRIFIVVLLFGAGTDFCLFFLARCREVLEYTSTPTRAHFYRAVGRAWRSVHHAIVASAMTTIVGLTMMWMSRFEKFRFSGPIIAISLAVTLAVCLTFTPALVSAIGRPAFWPSLAKPKRERYAGAGNANKTGQRAAVSTGDHSSQAATRALETQFWKRIWMRLADCVVARPMLALCVTTALLAVPAAYGWMCLGWVTYDFIEELSSDAPSRRGISLTQRFFSTNDSSPVTILMIGNEPFEDDEQLLKASDELSNRLYLDGVESVRSVNDPLGDYPPERAMGLLKTDAWMRRFLREHRTTRERYLSPVKDYEKRLARFDVVLKDNPFSINATETLGRLSSFVAQETQRTDSPWHKAQFTTVGTTVGITDLRAVTQADQGRIQILVTLGVWVVLLFLLRHWVLATYLIFTVLFSYFSTLGLTYAFFGWMYGSDYTGLDWKVPLFLFVILVAVGQDYNVYLTTRILDEQKPYGMLQGIRRALGLTGGIITSCGAVMAGTFVAMTSPAVTRWLATQWPWLGIADDAPVLRGITELGFALSLGVLLDTLVIRSILVPAFFALWYRPATRAQ